MRTALGNPFVPGSDAIPPLWAGRQAQISDYFDVIRPRKLAGLYERGRTILGEAGAGKSTLVRKIAADSERFGDWATPQIRIPADTDALKAVADAVLALAKQAKIRKTGHLKDVIKRVEAISISGVSLTLAKSPGMEPYTALRQLIIEIGRSAVKQQKCVLIHIDEVQNISNKSQLSQLLVALGDAMAYEHKTEKKGQVLLQHLPISVYLTGLPEFSDLVSANKATFGRRFQTIALRPMEDIDFELALAPLVNQGWNIKTPNGETTQVLMTQPASRKLAKLSCGEPFLFQLAGSRAWYAGSGSTITIDDVERGWLTVTGEATSHVERIISRLPERERAIIHAMAELPIEDRTATQIAQKAGFKSATDIGSATYRLDVDRGIIQRGKTYSFANRAIEAYLTTSWPNLAEE